MNSQAIRFLELLNGQVQYVVPRWQRRYCWGQQDIERLVEDLVTIANADSGATHYGGTLLTFPDPGAAGVVTTYRVVDGQQRLTTVSILLACIAYKLGADGDCNGWTRKIIFDHRLTNTGQPPEKLRKLRLQDGDEEEYRRGLEGDATGAGAVTQAWETARRLVNKSDVSLLLKGLERFRVVSIGLDDKEDPQQIFESLNATGRPLTESEKVKNWLLIGLSDQEQQDLHDNHWQKIESLLDSKHAGERMDLFLRDVLRWRTGQVSGIDRVYEGIRRWAVKSGNDRDRAKLCRELSRLARFYGMLTGTAAPYVNAKVDRELRHLREMGIDVHRPLTLRLLSDVDEDGRTIGGDAALARTLVGIGTWTTRMWLAGRPMAGLNRAFSELAHETGPVGDADLAEHWLGRVRRLRNTRVGVPNDEDVRDGMRTRKAYGGSATRATFAVLCELMEAEHHEEAPPRDRLTIEHVMPQKLTQEWKNSLGDDADETHGRYSDRLANLTLSGDATNSGMGASTFYAKRKVYCNSPVGITRLIADEVEWNEAALERRSEILARRALERWPWADISEQRNVMSHSAKLRWRIEDGPWRNESAASQMILNVASSLLSRDPTNARRLSGDAVSTNVHPAGRYPPGTMVGSLTMRAVPGHKSFVLYPFSRDYPSSAERCRNMGERCGVTVDVEQLGGNTAREFWKYLKEQVGGLPGQADTWRGATQWSAPEGNSVDHVVIHVGNPELLWLYIRAGDGVPAGEREARTLRYSSAIRDTMADQQLGDDVKKNAKNGWSITVQRNWVRDDIDEWSDAALWIQKQCDRLHAIVGKGLRSEP